VNGRGTSGFGPPVTPPIIKTLIIANAAVFFAQHLGDIGLLIRGLGAVRPVDVWGHSYVWQPFTYMWLHANGSLMHIGFNMFSLWMFGSPIAAVWGEKRFLRYYIICGVGAGVLIATLPYLTMYAGWGTSPMELQIPTVGASGAVMGVLLAYSFTWPDRTIMLLFPPIPLKAIWLIPLLFFMEFSTGPGNISHVGHLGGVLVGWIYLVREGRTPGAPTLDNLKHRYRRYRMRQKLRAVHDDSRRERQRWWENDDNDQNLH
jgi:membrane associated rhomboid family serine protease